MPKERITILRCGETSQNGTSVFTDFKRRRLFKGRNEDREFIENRINAVKSTLEKLEQH
jgi:hypothetical protein